jgi:organic hydroperoxide reductase OsmC/OhrA
MERNESKRLRIAHIDVAIQLAKDGAELAHLDRVLAQFEDFCTVTQSVQAGIPVRISVTDGKGLRLE